jgi:hypothetical protein
MRTDLRVPAAVAAGVVLVLVAGVALRWGLGRLERPRPAAVPPAAEAPAAPGAATASRAAGAPAPAVTEAGEGAPPPAAAGDDEVALEPPETAWAVVDLEAVRAALPDNLYWRMSSPTKDPDVLRQRAEERERWNVEYGKVLSNTATAEEVDAYYAHRQRLSSDYVAFAGYLLAAYGTALPARDVQLLKLAIKLHLARLEEIPRQIEEAHRRREAHDAARRAWREEQKAFADEP